MVQLRKVHKGSFAVRGALRARNLIDAYARDEKTPFGWFVLEDDSGESMEYAVEPYLDPPLRAWYYRTTEDASFYDMSDAATLKALEQALPASTRRIMRIAFPRKGNRVLRHSDPDVDNALVRGMVEAGLFETVRGWTHPTLPRQDGKVHRRETMALFPSKYLKNAAAAGSPRSSPRGSPVQPSSPTPYATPPVVRRSPRKSIHKKTRQNPATPKTPRR